MADDPLESYVERKACKWAKSNGWFIRKLSWIGRPSAPDRFFAKGGRVVLIEFKRRGKKPTKLQAREIEELREAGVETYVCDNADDAITVLNFRPNFRPDIDDLI